MPGNTVASFEKAVEVGVDLIEFDVLWTEDGHPFDPRGQAEASWSSPMTGTPPRPPGKGGEADPGSSSGGLRPAALDRVRINPTSLPGRDYEVFDAVRRHRLIERTSVSTMEISTVRKSGTQARKTKSSPVSVSAGRCPGDEGTGSACRSSSGRLLAMGSGFGPGADARQVRCVACPSWRSIRSGPSSEWSPAARGNDPRRRQEAVCLDRGRSQRSTPLIGLWGRRDLLERPRLLNQVT